MISKLQGQLQGETSLKGKISKLQGQLQGEISLKEKIRKLEKDLGNEQEIGATLQKETLSLKDMISKLQGQLQGEMSLTDSRIKELKSASNSLINELERQLKNKEMTIDDFKKKLTITFVDRLLFDLGKATITAEGGSILTKVGNILRNIHGMRIWIVGHTDNIPIKKEYRYKFPSNWELSSARAAAVASYFQKNNNIDPKTLTVIGRSFYEPLDTNKTKEGRARNRRVEIIIAPKLEKK
jgi:chemotaxis protein MotB